MVSTLESTNGGTPCPGEPYTFPSFGNFGPPYIATLSLPVLTIVLPVWLFSTPVISNPPNVSAAPNTLDVSTPPTHQPHVDFSPSSPINSPSLSPSSPSESSKASSQVDQKKKKWKEKKKKIPKKTKAPTTSDVGSKQPSTVNSTRSVDEVNKVKMKNLKPKFPCSLCKGDHFLMDFPGIPKVLEMWSSTSLASAGHVDDTPSTSDVKAGKKKTTAKFPCMLCKGDHYSHLFPRMNEASSLLEKLQLPKGYHKISPNPSLVNGLINLVPPPVILVDQMVNLVSSSIEPQTQVVDPVPPSISPTLHQKSVTQVVDPILSSVDPTLPLQSDTKEVDPFPSIDPILPFENEIQVVDLVLSSVDHTPLLTSAKVTDPVPSSVSPTLHPKCAKVVALVTSSVNPTLPPKSAKVVDPSPPLVDPIPPLVDPTLPLESKPDTTHIFLVDTGFTVLGGIPHSPMKPPPSNETILFDWGALTRPLLPSHIPFQITVQVCGQDVPQTLIDEGASISILPFVAWYALGCPQLAPVTQNLLAFNRRTSQPLGTLPQFLVTLGGKTIFIDVMVV
jgi:hypothetical protein